MLSVNIAVQFEHKDSYVQVYSLEPTKDYYYIQSQTVTKSANKRIKCDSREKFGATSKVEELDISKQAGKCSVLLHITFSTVFSIILQVMTMTWNTG